MSTGIIGGNVKAMHVVQTTLSPSSVAANTTAEQTFTVPNLAARACVFVNKPTSQAGLGIAGVRVSAANTLAINFVNATASPIVPTAAENYLVGILSPEGSATPTTIGF